MIRVATIAGSDASGGAGLEADLKTFAEYGQYGMAAVTVIATMDPNNNWAHGVFPIDEPCLRAQLETIFKGVTPAAAKTGMLATNYAVHLAAEYLAKYKITNYVLDPVMVCKGGDVALNPELNNLIIKKLLPIAKIITPNLFEAGQIAGMPTPSTVDEIKAAAEAIYKLGVPFVFIKGGSKLPNQKTSLDIFYDGENFFNVESELIQTEYTHGAGCTTAAAITAGLAEGLEPYESVRRAKKFITYSLKNGFEMNNWVGAGNPSAWRKPFN